jgi:antitoxin YefM
VQSMKEISVVNLRTNIDSVFDRVAVKKEVIAIRKGGRRIVVLLPAEELAGVLETEHLLRSPNHARRLLKALSRIAGARSRGRNSSSGQRPS